MPKAKPDSTLKMTRTSRPPRKRTRRKTEATPASTLTDLIVTDDNEKGDEMADSDLFSIVGIGASAGGYEALLQLLEQLPGDTGMAYVIVQHLDPKHESRLSELLARSTKLPLEEATHGMQVEPNHVYVIPPNVNLAVTDGHIRFQPRKPSVPHMPIDFCLRSLAQDRESRAIGVVLSGTGTDGTLGLQAIKGSGGITFAQDEKSAKYFGMPGSAIASGCVDLILSPEAIARELGRIAQHPYVSHVIPTTKPLKQRGRSVEVERVFQGRDEELQAVFSMLRVRTGVEFGLYKQSTLRRRIMRRMLLHRIDSLASYLQYARSHPAEVAELFDDLLINVTGFFRDPGVFSALKRRIYPKLVGRRAEARAVRVWVCGCSSGEEAYSLAISLVEFFETTHREMNVQIFATDISEGALEKARAGIYPENISQDVSAERLRRFFVKRSGSYQVNKSIRNMVVFARQNVIVDPPFSNLDVISCRNVLIYLGQTLQKKVMPIFHYALKPGGCLLLGSSEAIGAASHLFNALDKNHKLYAKKATAPDMGAFAPSGRHAIDAAERTRVEKPAAKVDVRPSDLQQYVDRLILSRWSPAAVAINGQMDVLLFRGRTGRYLEHVSGNASLNLLRMARGGVSLALRMALSRAMREDAPIREERIPVQDGPPGAVSIEVIPFRLTPTGEKYFLILFEEPGAVPHVEPAPATAADTRALQRGDRREVNRLTAELARSRESMQAIIEEQETANEENEATNEELKSASEEVLSSNEELQSANEELETAKEELQSTNEELTTLNEELQTRNLELGDLNNDLTNLLASVPLAIIMVTAELVIRRFTPQAERLFNLIPSDVGRRLSDLNRNVIVPDLDQSIREVVENLISVEREVQDSAGRWYALRIRPYRTRENKIDGAVLVLVDVDEHKRAVELIMEAVGHPLVALRGDLRVARANEAFYKTFRMKREAVESRFLHEVGNGQWKSPRLRTALEDVVAKQQNVDNFEIDAEFPGLGRRHMRLDASSYSEGGRGDRFVLLSIRDGVPMRE